MQISKKIVDQDVHAFLTSNYTLNELECNILAARLKNTSLAKVFMETYTSNKFPPIDSLFNLIDMSKATKRVMKAIQAQERILIACDYDADGLGAASILKLGFTALGLNKDNLHINISERYKGGYGFNDFVVDDILAMEKRPGLVITVDEGSSDHLRIKRLIEEDSSIDVIVTDHHHVPKQEPDLAHAFVNPNRPGDEFQHKEICGATVAFLLIKSINDLRVKDDKICMKPLMDIAAISTIGDVMPLNYPMNRAIIQFALKRANSENNIPLYWKVFKEYDPKFRGGMISEDTVGFSIAPKINAMSRIGKDAMHVINFLTSADEASVVESFLIMANCNEERKELDSVLYDASVEIMESQNNDFSNIIYLPEGQSGVTGIVASRIKEEKGKPAIVFCPKADNPEFITGSGRSSGGVDIRLAAEILSEQFDSYFFGGHPVACGLTIKADDLPKFKKLFDEEVGRQTGGVVLKPFVDYDFEMGVDAHLDEGFVYILENIAPFGQLFAKPNVLVEGTVITTKMLNGGHFKGTIAHQGGKIDFIWFAKNIGQNSLDFKRGQKVSLIGKAGINEFMGNRTIQVLIEHME